MCNNDVYKRRYLSFLHNSYYDATVRADIIGNDSAYVIHTYSSCGEVSSTYDFVCILFFLSIMSNSACFNSRKKSRKSEKILHL